MMDYICSDQRHAIMLYDPEKERISHSLCVLRVETEEDDIVRLYMSTSADEGRIKGFVNALTNLSRSVGGTLTGIFGPPYYTIDSVSIEDITKSILTASGNGFSGYKKEIPRNYCDIVEWLCEELRNELSKVFENLKVYPIVDSYRENVSDGISFSWREKEFEND